MGNIGRHRNAPRQKTMLDLADFGAVENASFTRFGEASSQASYGHAINEFIGWYCSEHVCIYRRLFLRYRFFLEQKNSRPPRSMCELAAVSASPMKPPIRPS